MPNETKPDKIEVIIVDDHQVVIDGIKAMLSSSKNVQITGQAHNGKEALQVIKVLAPNLVLLDINMPEMDGIEACKLIARDFPDIKILMLSMLKEQSMVKKALKQGAHGYVLKNEGRDELLQAIHLVCTGEKYISGGILVKGLAEKNYESNRPRISRREKQVLKLIIEEYTAKEIANKLFITVNTVDAHRKNLLMKLEARNTAGLVRIAMENGLVR